jgi:hypothetical protein
MKVFGYIHKQIKQFIKKVMGFNAANFKGDIKPHVPTPSSSNQLTTQEIEVLLSLIKRTTFLGEDIEPLYNLVLKLQNQHTEQNK